MTIPISVSFTQNAGAVATGLTLADIALYLTSVNKSTGADTVIWDGTQHPTSEIDNVGAYLRIYSGEDLDTYDYHAAAHYTGATALDFTWATGVLSSEAQRTADVLLQRDMDQVETSAPVHSLTSAVLKSVSKTKDLGDGTIATYRTNGSTLHMLQAISTDNTAESIVEIGAAT
jgi:hypothetical protein